MSQMAIATQFGLMNYEGRYLTAEKFGNQINVKGNALRSKQIWMYEQEADCSSKGYLRNQQQRYLETGKNGNVLCESSEKEKEYLFDVEVTDDGKWAFKDVFGKYLTGNTERLHTVLKRNAESLWAIHVTNHPHCNVRNVSRQQYVTVNDNEFQANVDIPWGMECIVTLEFCKGKYAVKDTLGRYLNGVTGALENTCNDDCLLSILIQESSFAFRASNGKYLTVYGPNGKLVATKKAVGKDELFAFEGSKAQCFFTANNGKKVTLKGIDATANQVMEVSDTEIFQLDFHPDQGDKVSILARNKNYFVANEKSITASSSKLTENCYCEMKWQNEKVALKASNGKYITSSSGGQLTPSSETCNDPNSLFALTLVNRQRIILRGDQGYIGTTSNKVQCNLGSPDTLDVSLHNGKCKLKTKNGSYLKVACNLSMVANSDEGDLFSFELCGINKMLIKARNGKYLAGYQNGTIMATSEQCSGGTIWEY